MGSLGPTVTESMVNMVKSHGAAGGAAGQQQAGGVFGIGGSCGFRMPVHYPRYKKADYGAIPEWRVDCLREYGLPADGDLDSKRPFAMGAFLSPGQY